jgi:hypothetical protein
VRRAICIFRPKGAGWRYSPSCLEEAFSETARLPVYGFLRSLHSLVLSLCTFRSLGLLHRGAKLINVRPRMEYDVLAASGWLRSANGDP